MLAAAEQVPYSCGAGNAFTIRIPVRFPDSMTVQYRWYRNNALIAGTEATLPTGEKTIAYTIPADKANGDNVAFHFEYCLNDECSDVWTRSPQYVVTFWSCPQPEASAITGSTTVCMGQSITYSVTNAAGTTYDWTIPSSWTKTAGGNTSSITVTAGNAGGTVNVTPSNNCGKGSSSSLAVTVSATLSRSGGAASQTVCQNSAITNVVYTRSGSATGFSTISWSPSTPAGISTSGGGSGTTYTISGTPTTINAYTYTVSTTGGSCAATATGTITRGGVSPAGTVSVAAAAACSGITTAGTISISAYNCSGGISGAGTISVAADISCEGGISVPGEISISVAN